MQPNTESSPDICITAEEVRMMLGENAAKLYGFDLEALSAAATVAKITPELVSTPLDEIPTDSMCLAFQRVRAERAMDDAGSLGA